MHENEVKEEHRKKHENRLDSYSLGSSSKTGAIKVYFDLSTMTDEEAKKLCSRAKGLAAYIGVQ